MKNWKIIGIIAVVLVVIVLSFVVGNKGDDYEDMTLSNDPNTIMANAQSESSSISTSEMKEPNQIDVYQYLEYREASEATIILLARPTCGYCQIAEPIIKNVAYRYNLEINYLNTDNFTEEAQALFVQSDEEFSSGFGTPLLFIVKDGAIIDEVDGLTDRAHYIEFFRANGFIE